MKVKILFMILFCCRILTVNAGNNSCNLDLLLQLNQHIDTITTNELVSFLNTFDDSCIDNIEFYEVRNELLFTLLTSHYASQIIIILTHNKNIKLQNILFAIENPIDDSIDVKKTLHNVTKVKNENCIKKTIINSLIIAISKVLPDGDDL
jgi:hypothetical protein